MQLGTCRLIFGFLLFIWIFVNVVDPARVSTLLESSRTAARGIVSSVDDDPAHDTLLRLFSRSFEPSGDGIVSAECRRDSILYRQALVKYKPWALRMYDSSTKIPSGLMTGNDKQLGNYDECLRVRSDSNFVGKACSAQVVFIISESDDDDDDDDDNVDKELDMGDLLINVALAAGLTNWTSGRSVPFEWLWCVPSSCDSRDISETIEVALDPLKRSARVDFVVTVGNDSCHTQQSDRAIFDLADWLYISLLVLCGCTVAASTCYDLMKRRSLMEKPDSEGIKHTICTSFSAYSNGKSLLNVHRGADSIACLDGLRFLSICWIIYGHTHYLEIIGAKLDLSDVSTMHENWSNLLLLNGNIVTDTFFLLSGILLAYTEMGRKKKNPGTHRLSISTLYVHRYLRLTPAYAIVIGFYATLFYKIGSGPHWDKWVGANRDFCRENWWTNLLYVNNYVNVANMCMSQSWYLAVDMQLVWITPIFLYPMLSCNGTRLRRLVLVGVLLVGFLASVLAPLLITYFNRLTGTMLYYKDQTDVGNVYLQIYTRVYTRAGPYLLGLGLGYFLRTNRTDQSDSAKMPIALVVGGWTIALVAGFAVVFGPRGMYFAHHGYDGVEAAFYAGLHRPVFAISVGWIVIATVYGCAGPIGAFLCWSGWVPLSKLTYSAYLTHYIILLYNAGIIRTPGSLKTFGVVQTFFGNLATTLIISALLSISFEIPFIRLDRLLTGAGNAPTSVNAAAGRFDPMLDSRPFGFGAPRRWDSIREMYRPINEVASSVSRTYKDLMDRYARVSVGSSEDRARSAGASIANSSSASDQSPDYRLDLDGDEPSQHPRSHRDTTESDGMIGRRNFRVNCGLDNEAFENTS